MQGTSNLHHLISSVGLAQTAGVFDNAAAFDTVIDMLDADSPRSNGSILDFLFSG
jgi:hypothetical protein